MSKIQQYADDLAAKRNAEMLFAEYARAYDIISRMFVWFSLSRSMQRRSKREMFMMVNAFMQTAHDPYETDDIE